MNIGRKLTVGHFVAFTAAVFVAGVLIATVARRVPIVAQIGSGF